jgi:hypothetical protein
MQKNKELTDEENKHKTQWILTKRSPYCVKQARMSVETVFVDHEAMGGIVIPFQVQSAGGGYTSITVEIPLHEIENTLIELSKPLSDSNSGKMGLFRAIEVYVDRKNAQLYCKGFLRNLLGKVINTIPL